MSKLALFCKVTVLGVLAAPHSAGQPPQAPSASRGQRIVHASCETCHSLEPGVTKIGPPLYGLLNGPSPRSTSSEAVRIVREGRRQMPAYASVFKRDEFESIALYLRELP